MTLSQRRAVQLKITNQVTPLARILTSLGAFEAVNFVVLAAMSQSEAFCHIQVSGTRLFHVPVVCCKNARFLNHASLLLTGQVGQIPAHESLQLYAVLKEQRVVTLHFSEVTAIVSPLDLVASVVDATGPHIASRTFEHVGSLLDQTPVFGIQAIGDHLHAVAQRIVLQAFDHVNEQLALAVQLADRGTEVNRLVDVQVCHFDDEFVPFLLGRTVHLLLLRFA